MEDVIDTLTRGNPTEVKVVIASAALALAVYQLVLISIGYGKVRVPFLAPAPASTAHRAVGDTLVVLIVVVAVMCIAYFGFEEGGVHVVAAIGLLAALALKVAVVRRWHGLSRFLPAIGISVWLLLALTWLTSAGDFLGDA